MSRSKQKKRICNIMKFDVDGDLMMSSTEAVQALFFYHVCQCFYAVNRIACKQFSSRSSQHSHIDAHTRLVHSFSTILMLSRSKFLPLTVMLAAKHCTYLAVVHGCCANRKHERYFFFGTSSKLLKTVPPADSICFFK